MAAHIALGGLIGRFAGRDSPFLAVLALAGVLASIYGFIRFYFLFPATTVDSPYAKPGVAFRLSRGRSWRIVKIGLWIIAPIFALVFVAVAAHGVARHPRPDEFVAPLRLQLAFCATALLMDMVLVAAGGRLFRETLDEDAAPPRAPINGAVTALEG